MTAKSVFLLKISNVIAAGINLEILMYTFMYPNITTIPAHSHLQAVSFPPSLRFFLPPLIPPQKGGKSHGAAFAMRRWEWCSVRSQRRSKQRFPLLAEEGSGVVCYIYILRSTLVHGLCTPNT